MITPIVVQILQVLPQKKGQAKAPNVFNLLMPNPVLLL